MKKVLFYLVTDLHIDDNSGELVTESLESIFKEMVANSISTLVISGDIFNFRKSQTLITIDYWGQILEMAEKYDIQIIVIPGNHDKMSYSSEKSYLDVFRYHPHFRLVRETEVLTFDNLNVWLIPFFEEKETYSKYLGRVVQSSCDSILITHIAVNGVRNNDGTEIQESLSKEKFSQFKQVYVGHYHDRQIIDNIVYIGSIMQRNFGEDQYKGFTKIFNDGSYEFVDKEFQVYETVKLNYSDTIADDLEKLSKIELSKHLKVRVILNGTKEELDSLKKLQVMRILDNSGFVMKSDYISVDKVELELAESFTPFTKDNLFTEWDEFSELNSIDKEKGRETLKLLLE